MSCPCDGREFAPLGDTWTPKSSLRDNDWSDPYPELQRKVPAKENFSGDAGEYALNSCQKPAGPPAVNGYKMSNPQPLKKENYNQPCCRPGPYINMKDTWSEQKPYTLN